MMAGSRLQQAVTMCLPLALLVGAALAQAPKSSPRTVPGPDSPPARSEESAKAYTEAKPLVEFESKGEPEHIIRSDAEWRRLLTQQQYYVTRLKATEPAWSGKYAKGHPVGIFTCVGCGAELFSSRHKFQSGTGWPSFYQPINAKALSSAMDYSNPMEARMEVTCRRCDSHLGHVFQDGPRPTGLRFCINSLALKLKPFPTDESARKTVKSNTQGKDVKAAAKSTPKTKTAPR